MKDRRNKWKKKLFFLILFIIPLFLLVPIVVGFFNRDLVIFPDMISPDHIEPRTYGGNSTIEEFSLEGDKVRFQFIVRAGAQYPGAFIMFWLDEKGSYVDLGKYESFSLKVSETSAKSCVIFIKTFVPGFSTYDHADAPTLRHNEVTLKLSPDIHNYTVALKDFKTESWWYILNKVSQEVTGKESFAKVVSFDIHFVHRAYFSPTEDLDNFILDEIVFHKPFPFLSVVLLSVLVLFYIILLIWFFRFRNRHCQPVMEYTHLELNSSRDEELDALKKVIKTDYYMPDISTSMVMEKTGIPSSRAYSLIKDEYGMTFKQLIHKIRLTEAKRLLVETDRKITDIAFKVGFNDLSYFNKLFKKNEGTSPRQYRSLNKK